MNNITAKLNDQKLEDFHRAAAQYRRACAADVHRKPGMRSATAKLLRRTADFIDNGRGGRAHGITAA